MNPRNQISQPLVQQHQNQSDVDGDQIVPLARMQKKTGMASTKSNSSKPTKTLKHKIHSRRILSKPKTWGNSSSEPSVYPWLIGTTEPPAHLDTMLWCTGQICVANPSKKRVGGEDGMAQWKVWTWLFLRLRVIQSQMKEKIHLRREWEEKMEWHNEKYGLDYFSDSELFRVRWRRKLMIWT